MQCWRRMEKISWTGRVKNEEVLHRAKEKNNILHTITRRKANWIGQTLRNTLLQERYKKKIRRKGRQGRRRKKLLDDLTESRGYCHLKEEAVDRTMLRARFGGGFGPVVRQTTKWIQILSISHWTRQGLRRFDSHMGHTASAMSFKWYVLEAPVLILRDPRFFYRFDYSFLFFPSFFFVPPSHIRMFSWILQSLRADHYLLLTFLYRHKSVWRHSITGVFLWQKEDRLKNAFP